MAEIVIFKRNDQTITVTGLRNAETGVFLNAATVRATLLDPSGQPVSGFNNLSLSYIASSNGNYRGQVEETFDPPEGTGYTLVVDATEGTLVGHWEIPAVIRQRRSP